MYSTAALGVISRTVTIHIPREGRVVVRTGCEVLEVNRLTLADSLVSNAESGLRGLANLVSADDTLTTVSRSTQVQEVLAVSQGGSAHLVIADGGYTVAPHERNRNQRCQIVIPPCFHFLHLHLCFDVRIQERAEIGLTPVAAFLYTQT